MAISWHPLHLKTKISVELHYLNNDKTVDNYKNAVSGIGYKGTLKLGKEAGGAAPSFINVCIRHGIL